MKNFVRRNGENKVEQCPFQSITQPKIQGQTSWPIVGQWFKLPSEMPFCSSNIIAPCLQGSEHQYWWTSTYLFSICDVLRNA